MPKNYDDYDGAVFIFERNRGGADNWGLVKMIDATGLSKHRSYLGQSVAISGDTIAVGAVIEYATGGVFVFERDLGGVDYWGERTLIEQPTIAGEFLGFGEEIALEGDTLIASSTRETVHANRDGAAYVFERDYGGTDHWGRVGQIAGAGDTGEEFGADLALDGDTLVVGSPGYSVYTKPEGAIFVFERNVSAPAHWEKISMLQDPEGHIASENFGYSVSIDGDTVVAGNPNTYIHYDDDGLVVAYGTRSQDWTDYDDLLLINNFEGTDERVLDPGGFLPYRFDLNEDGSILHYSLYDNYVPRIYRIRTDGTGEREMAWILDTY